MMYRPYKKNLCLLLLLFSTIVLISCNKKEQTDIVTTLYPQYDMAKQIVGNKLTVSLMTPFGSEVHEYEPTAKDIIHVQNAKLFLYTSDVMERWAKNIIDKKTHAINLSKSYKLIPYENNDTVIDQLHYWTDPTTMMQLLKVIKEAIIEIDPDNANYYEENAAQYLKEIQTVHNELITFLREVDHPKIFFYGHNALAAFGSRYHLEIISLSTNYKPDAELSSGQLLTLKNKIIEEQAKYLFVEELIYLKAPNALKEELSKEGYEIIILELHGFHNISKKQHEEGVRYVDLLKQNLNHLKTALN